MKNTLIAVTTLTFFAMIGYTMKIRAELKELKELAEINTKETTEHQKQYPNTVITIGNLPEPYETTYADTLERIKILRQHLPYQPSTEWIENVINSAEVEIKSLQINR